MNQQDKQPDERQGGPRMTITVPSVLPDTDELEYAIRLAARLGARLEGLFIEDTYLLDAAALPHCQEIRATSFSVERLNQGRIELEMRIASRRAERTFTDYARRQGLTPSFRVWRGAFDTGLLAATLESDVVALARYGRGLLPRAPRKPATRGIAVLVNASDVGERALLTGSQLARDSAASLTLWVSAPDNAARDKLTNWIEQDATRLDLPAYTLLTIDNDSLAHMSARTPNSVLVVPRDHPWLQISSRRDLFGESNSLVLFVR